MATDWSALLGGAGQAAGGLLGFYNNPADAAMEYSEQLYDTISPYYNPYIKAGRMALGVLGPEYYQLINDPYSQMDEMASGFQPSPGYEYQYNQSMNAINTAAAAGGVAGSPAHQQAASDQASASASQDYWNYMNYMNGLYRTGLGGMGDINQMGYGASSELAGYLAQNLMNMSRIAAMGARAQNSAIGNVVGGVMDVANPTNWF